MKIKNFLTSYCLCAAALWVLACAAVGQTGDILLPRPTGPRKVGRVSYYRVDTSRPELFTEDPNDHREVKFHIWYPTDDTGGTPASYVDVSADDDVFKRSYSFVGLDRVVRTRSSSLIGVGLSGSRRQYPVVIFSHGLGTVSGMYSAFIEDLASHGYIVVGVDSPYFSAAIRMPDGRIIVNQSRRDTKPGAREEEAVVQARDLVFVLDELGHIDKDDTEHLFTGRLDLEHLGVFGHSRGGFAAPHACLLDRRFKACLNLDGYGMTPDVMKNGISQPYMHIEEIEPWLPPPTDQELAQSGQTRAEADRQARDMKDAREVLFGRKMKSGTYLVTVKGAVHNSFSNSAMISPDRYPAMKIDPVRAVEITRAYILAFFDKTLLGRRSALLAKEKSPFPEATLKIYPKP